MGAWGVGHFQNDGAGDFAGDVADNANWSSVRDALSAVSAIADDDYLEAPLCEHALAAAAIIAHLRGTLPTNAYPEYFEAIGKLGTPSPEDVQLATEAAVRVRANSELRELWDESGSGADWLAEVDKLLAALAR